MKSTRTSVGLISLCLLMMTVMEAWMARREEGMGFVCVAGCISNQIK